MKTALTTTLSIAAIGLPLAFASSADASLVSVKFGLSNHNLAAGDTTGATGYEAANWNNTSSPSGSVADLVDSNGAATTADITWTGDEIWRQTADAQSAPGLNLMASFINDTSGETDGVPNDPNEISISEIPYTLYDVVVYVHGEGGRDVQLVLTAGNVSTTKDVNLTPNYDDTRYSDDPENDGQYAVTNGFVLDSGVYYDDEPSTANQGNYTIFEGLTSDSFTVTYGGTSGRGSVAGIQIYEVPEPGTVAIFGAGIGGMMLLRSRRSRRA